MQTKFKAILKQAFFIFIVVSSFSIFCSCEKIERILKIDDSVAELNSKSELQNKIITAQSSEIEYLKLRINEIEAINEFKINNINSEFRDLSNRFNTAWRNKVVLDITAKNFQSVDTYCGKFFVFLEDVKPYLSGQKLKLNIGNPSHVAYQGFSLSAKWGKEPDMINYEEWENNLKEKEFTFTETLKPGLWNTVYLVLSPAKNNEFEYLEISLVPKTVTMAKGKSQN